VAPGSSLLLSCRK